MKLSFDGACAPKNPGGHTAYGFCLESKWRIRRFGYLGCGRDSLTNNVAEYTAMIEGLKTAKALCCDELEVCGDSQLVIKQMTGEYGVHSESMQALHAQAVELTTGCRVTYTWKKREENREADALSRYGLALGLSLAEDFEPLSAYRVVPMPGPDKQYLELVGRTYALISWKTGEDAVCGCKDFKGGMGMCRHMAALFLARRCRNKPVLLCPSVGELEEVQL